MDFRCSDCLESHWIDRFEPLRSSDELVCPGCGKVHVVDPAPLLGSTLGSHYRNAVAFANEMQIDMPSAYSVLLQIVTLDDVLKAQGRAPAEATPVAPDEVEREGELSDEELALLERLTFVKAPDSPKGSSAQEISYLEPLEPLEPDVAVGASDPADRAAEGKARRAFFPDLDEAELGLLDDLFMEGEVGKGPTSKAGTPGSPLLSEIDPAFARAVAKGHLTVQEALRRGSRDTYARDMSGRHGLPMRLAYAVADNRVTLHKAVRYRDAARQLRPATPARKRRDVPWWGVALVVGIASTLVGLATWESWSRNFRPTRPEIHRARSTTPPPEQARPTTEPDPTTERTAHQQALRSATAVQRDEMGRVTQVTGPDPGNVLWAYCESVEGHEFLEPMEVTETLPVSRQARLGVFRDRQSVTVDRAIRIRHDRRSRRWVAGDGVHPIQVMDRPDLPPGAFRTSVADR